MNAYTFPAGANVDDQIPLDLDSASEKKPYDLQSLQSNVLRSKYSVYIPTYKKDPEEKVSFICFIPNSEFYFVQCKLLSS